MDVARRSTAGPAAGAFVVLVGPDGVGKSTVARALIERQDGPAAYFHFVPRLRRPLDSRPPEQRILPPKATDPTGWRALGLARLAYNVVRYWIGYLCRVRPALRAGTLIVGDRSLYGYIVQPTALRFYGPEWVARAAIRLLPRPTLIANLHAPCDVVRARKQELEMPQIESELRAWRQLAGLPVVTFSATNSPGMIADAIVLELKRLSRV